MDIKFSNKIDIADLKINDLKHILDITPAKNLIDTYLLSPMYYKLTGRSGMSVYYNEQSFVITIKHPHVNNAIIVFPEVMDDSDFMLTSHVIQKIIEKNKNIYLCRYTDLNYRKLKKSLKKDIVFKKIVEEDLDWKYPLRILDTELVSKLSGNRFMKIRNMCVRAGKEVEIVSLEKKHLDLMKFILKLWEEKLKSTGRDVEDMFGFYYELFKMFGNGFKINGLMFLKQNTPMGFTVWDICKNNNVANLFVNLFDPTIRGASDFQIVNTCRCLQKQKIPLLNMGGSETESLDFFKNKYRPIISHEVFTYKLINKMEMIK